jgi:GAF domain-containing protein
MRAPRGRHESAPTVLGEGQRALAQEQAALRRVATLVAGEATPEEVFAAVTEEVGQLLGVAYAGLNRYEPDGTATIVAVWARDGDPVLPGGARPSLGGKNIITMVFETAGAARIDGYGDATGALGRAARDRGIGSGVGTPILVQGRLWGVMSVYSAPQRLLAADAEDRLASFTELVATAIANAEGRSGLGRLAEEQAALRRVATLVAHGVLPEELFAAVTEEVALLLPVDFAIMSRYDPSGAITVLATSGTPIAHIPIGNREALGGHNVSTRVFETGRPARIDAYSDSSSGDVGAAGREQGVRSAVAAPIVVERGLWGVMIVGTTQEKALPADTEDRLGSFTELVGTAIANAESRAGLARLAEEQAALRRVATLVARAVPPEGVFAAVTEEVGQLLPVDLAILGRFEDDGSGTSLATWGEAAARFHVGSRWTLEGKNLATTVFETGRSARSDRYLDASGPIGVTGRESGFRSGVATPITVDRRLWGVIVVGSTRDRALPADTEARLESFTELVATAIANAESRSGLARLATEQASLRRVATLVAQGVPPEELFSAVAEEVVRLLPVDFAHMGRYEPDGTITVLAASGSTADQFPAGRRWTLGGKNLATIVFETGRPGRIDGYADAFGSLGVMGRELGMRSSAATPIIVEGEVWGVVVAGSTLDQRLPRGIEGRLGSFTELVATAIANAESRSALAASRARIVAAADEGRRRIERDLHDGAQQRLVHAVIVLKLALRALARDDTEGEELVAEALRHAEEANAELRELAHGILPAALIRGGLRAGVEALVSRTSLPVSVDVTSERLAHGVEATAYFVVSEALTNVVKHAGASAATVTARVQGDELRVEICDDGVGGARGGQETGLGGLEDRLSALDGRLVLDSPPGEGTRICALLPIPDQDESRR